MSRRQRTTLVLSVRIHVPPGKTQKQVVAAVQDTLTSNNTVMPPDFASHETLVKIERRETVYL